MFKFKDVFFLVNPPTYWILIVDTYVTMAELNFGKDL
jgi:hypothetical protein